MPGYQKENNRDPNRKMNKEHEEPVYRKAQRQGSMSIDTQFHQKIK